MAIGGYFYLAIDRRWQRRVVIATKHLGGPDMLYAGLVVKGHRDFHVGGQQTSISTDS